MASLRQVIAYFIPYRRPSVAAPRATAFGKRGLNASLGLRQHPARPSDRSGSVRLAPDALPPRRDTIHDVRISASKPMGDLVTITRTRGDDTCGR